MGNTDTDQMYLEYTIKKKTIAKCICKAKLTFVAQSTNLINKQTDFMFHIHFVTKTNMHFKVKVLSRMAKTAHLGLFKYMENPNFAILSFNLVFLLQRKPE